MNQAILVGRLVEMQDGKDNELNIKIEVREPYKHTGEDDYRKYVVPCKLIGEITKNTKEYCKVGDIIGVKGFFVSDETTYIRVEKVTFLSSHRDEEENEEEGSIIVCKE